jgi:hypothetical protein
MSAVRAHRQVSSSVAASSARNVAKNNAEAGIARRLRQAGLLRGLVVAANKVAGNQKGGILARRRELPHRGPIELPPYLHGNFGFNRRVLAQEDTNRSPGKSRP